MSSEDLKPCPFCGCTDISLDDDGDNEWLKCDWCGAIGGVDPAPEFEGETINWHWNRRPQPSPSSADKISDAEVEAAARAMEPMAFREEFTATDEWYELEQEGRHQALGRARAALEAAAATRRAQSAVVGDDALRIAARNLIAGRFDTYKAKNGRYVSIKGDDGEKCWIVNFDEMHELEAALNATQEGK